MSRYYAPILLVLAALPGAWAAEPTIEAPKSVSGEPGDFIKVTVKTDGKSVRFYPLSPGLKFFPADLLTDPKTTVVTASRPGKYKLLAYTGTADGPSAPAVIEVVVTGPAPVPPGPNPNPNPPGPPVPPVPTDPLTKSLADALAKESDPNKKAIAVQLAGVMTAAVGICDDPTAGDSAVLTSRVTDKRKQLVGEALPNVRLAIGAYLAGQFGQDLFTLNPENRAKLKAAYAKLAQSLTEISR